jgi:hypothetical protein
VRAAVISDTHLPRGTRALPPRAIEILTTADLILHAGDFSTAEILAQLKSYGPPVHAVHGNVDDAMLRGALPETAIVEIADARIGMVHIPGPSVGRLERLRILFGAEVDAVVFGHTHMPEHQELDGFQIFNPGSPTERRRAPRHTMGIADVTGSKVAFQLIDL